MLLPPGRLGTGDYPYNTSSTFTARGQSEILAKSLASKGICTAIMRLAPINHGDDDDHTFMSTLIATAREKGAPSTSAMDSITG